jgi:hypothetical protein
MHGAKVKIVNLYSSMCLHDIALKYRNNTGLYPIGQIDIYTRIMNKTRHVRIT